MNRKLLLKVRERILADAQAFNMQTFEGMTYLDGGCKTTHCIAGYVVLESELTDKRVEEIRQQVTWDVSAENLLRITEEQADSLFFVDAWPVDFRVHYAVAQSATEMATVAVKRIDHFLETGE